MNSTKIAILIALFPVLLLSAERVSAFYDPGAQRWINRDPMGEQGGINVYAYVGSDPVNQIDPSGQCVFAPAIWLVMEWLGSLGISAETGVLLGGSAVAAGAGIGVGSALNGHRGSGGRSIAPPIGLTTINTLPTTITSPFPIFIPMGKGERNWERARGDDPFWDLTPEQLRDIENDANSTPSEKARARKIRKQKEKDCS